MHEQNLIVVQNLKLRFLHQLNIAGKYDATSWLWSLLNIVSSYCSHYQGMDADTSMYIWSPQLTLLSKAKERKNSGPFKEKKIATSYGMP